MAWHLPIEVGMNLSGSNPFAPKHRCENIISFLSPGKRTQLQPFAIGSGGARRGTGVDCTIEVVVWPY